jgi:alpha-mannosidase
VLLDQVTEYEVVDGRELALTVLRSFGLISRNANPYREDPAGPEVPVPAAQLPGRRTFSFALLPGSGAWTSATLAAAEAYRHPFETIRGRGPRDAIAVSVPGLRLDGEGVVLSAVRRRDDGLEVRVVNEGAERRDARLRLAGASARTIDLLGRPGEALPMDADGVALDLGPWEIRTVLVQP